MNKFISVEQVVEIHDAVIKLTGGASGIRDHGLLESSVESAKCTWAGQYLHETIYDKAAAYLFHIVQNHPFVDGNKRTGTVTSLLFLQENNVVILHADKEIEDFVVEIAKGLKDKKQIAEFLMDKNA